MPTVNLFCASFVFVVLHVIFELCADFLSWFFKQPSSFGAARLGFRENYNVKGGGISPEWLISAASSISVQCCLGKSNEPGNLNRCI